MTSQESASRSDIAWRPGIAGEELVRESRSQHPATACVTMRDGVTDRQVSHDSQPIAVVVAVEVVRVGAPHAERVEPDVAAVEVRRRRRDAHVRIRRIALPSAPTTARALPPQPSLLLARHALCRQEPVHVLHVGRVGRDRRVPLPHEHLVEQPATDPHVRERASVRSLCSTSNVSRTRSPVSRAVVKCEAAFP